MKVKKDKNEKNTYHIASAAFKATLARLRASQGPLRRFKYLKPQIASYSIFEIVLLKGNTDTTILKIILFRILKQICRH